MSDNLYRSTTPTIVLHIKDDDFNMDDILICHLTIQNDSGRNKKVFPYPEINVEDRTIMQTLSQEDTKMFEEGLIELQLKIRLTDDTVMASKIITTTMKRILEEEPL